MEVVNHKEPHLVETFPMLPPATKNIPGLSSCHYEISLQQYLCIFSQILKCFCHPLLLSEQIMQKPCLFVHDHIMGYDHHSFLVLLKYLTDRKHSQSEFASPLG